MALAHDLLVQSEYLAHLDGRRPKQASLRRAVSTAYYALFHLLVRDAIQRLSPGRPAGLSARIGRAFSHGEMKKACQSILERRPSPVLSGLAPQGFSPDLALVAQAFVELQEARHAADYDLAADLSRTETLDYVQQASDAFSAWGRVRGDDEATVFLAALLFAARWSK